MPLQGDDIADLVSVTLRDLGRMKWTEIATDIQEHIAMKQLLRKNKVTFQSGYGIQWNVMYQHSGAAKNVGMYGVDQVNVADVMTTANIPWRHCTTNYAFERREIAMNRTPARIVELIKVRRADSMISLAELMEQNFWSKPTDSTDNVKPFGLPYWCVEGAAGEEGFFGDDPSGFASGAAGLPVATYGRWRNYAADYATISKSDLVRKWRKASVFTNFMSPTEIPSYNTGNRYGYYTTYAVIGALEEALEAQNENLGNDIASKDGLLHFRRNPVNWVPYLETTAGIATTNGTNPIYGINWGVFRPVFLKGEYMREEPPEKAANQHTTYQVHVDMTMNFECRDRRRLFVLSQV